jgi:hypothetical protein
MMRLLLCCVVLAACAALAACVPAPAPPMPLFAPVIVTEDAVTTADFALRYPRGWRVILGEAAAPPSVTLVMPGDCGLIVAAAAPLEAAPALPDSCPAQRQTQRAQVAGVTLVGAASSSVWAAFAAAFQAVVDSVTPS